MKRLLVLVLAFMLLPGVAASSSITGWLPFPARVGVDGGDVLVRDISLSDGSVLVYPNGMGMRVVPVGGSILWDGYSFSFHNALYSSEMSYLNLSYTFPYILEGEKLFVGDYEVLLKSVSEKGGTLVVSSGETSKEIYCAAGKEVSYGNLGIFLTPMPVLFDGYLKRDKNVSVGEWSVVFYNYTVSSENGGLTEIVDIRVSGKQYLAEPGETIDAGGLLISVGELVGSDYLKATIRLKGAYIRVKVHPSFEGWLREGKTEKLGPYLVRVDKIFNDSAYVSIMNPCGRVIRSGFITIGNFSSGIYYGGLLLGATASRKRDGAMEVHVVAFIDEEKVPKVSDVALLNVSFLAPGNATQFVPFEARIIIKNEGPNDLKYVEVNLNLSDGFGVLGDYPSYFEEIPKGKSVEIPLRLLPEKAGNLSLGNVVVTGHAPYALSCYGVEEVSFSSENRAIDVAPAKIGYRVEVSASNGSVGKEIPLNVTVMNTGNAELPFTLTVALPKGFASIAENFTAYGKWLTRTDTLAPNGSRTYSLTVIPLAPGEYEISVGVESHGKVFYNSTTIKVTGETSNVLENSSIEISNESTNSTCEPKVVTEVIKVPVPCNESNVTAMSSEGGMSLKEKLIYIGGSFVGGIVFILLLAWIAARMEER
ncbi:hypothetical protein [Thermococcus sp. 5-4]|uniref:hypothetical protein n=1 Tax=Thermococcus sp. 5-4 TaxID=2008440 RepID=UPI000B49E751|nr:hypothetical protein [Thermococcus sp. 5-4]ASA77765.1 hypothetical protein CDI07_05465 [Thermococcus sp. 5-4]